eukprot:scaffold4185_cov143-Pinguiococcus_pyrenoidosus.AAC.1
MKPALPRCSRCAPRLSPTRSLIGTFVPKNKTKEAYGETGHPWQTDNVKSVYPVRNCGGSRHAKTSGDGGPRRRR